MESIEIGKYKLICFTDVGNKLMHRLRDGLVDMADGSYVECEEVKEGSLDYWTKDNFRKGNILVFVGATGIAVRAIAPYVNDKKSDPGIVVIDEQGRFVIPILSGHIGGAVDAAKTLSDIIGATPVITTATDARGEFAVDVFAKRNSLTINSMKKAKEYTATLLRNGEGSYAIDSDFSKEIIAYGMPENIILKENPDKTSFFISPRGDSDLLCLIPRCLIVGIGCKKGKTFEELKCFLQKTFQNENLDIRAMKSLCSIDLKKDEPGLLSLSDFLQVPFETYTAEYLMKQKGDFTASDFARSVTGADNICERSVVAYGCERLILRKTSENGMTIAIGVAKTVMEN